jgi:hypothetical protein
MRETAECCRVPGERALERERDARMSAVRLVRMGRVLGLTRLDVALDLALGVQTLRTWERRWKSDRLAVQPLGRPRCELSRAQRQMGLWALHQTAGAIGVRDLMTLVWPPAPRRALEDLKRRYRNAVHRRGGRLCAKLRWTRAGVVWALDWTDPDGGAVEGMYTKILFVRDLASGRVLKSLPCVRESGRVVARVLEELIACHGPPAVVKVDNGGSLSCRSVRLVLAHHGILLLLSPPACPGYNGACEAGIGSLKVRTEHVCAARGGERGGTCADVETARCWCNARVRENGLSADDVWSTRRAFSEGERDELWQRYRAELAIERERRGIAPQAILSRMEQASVDRVAISRAMEGKGLLQFRRRWIRPPIRGRKVSRKW